jgi:serine/threonine protein kinase/Tol biopolymer transport system component
MTLSAGTQLAHYEILDLIGRGGMGEVYRAKDSKLGRDVAIKVLPDEFAQDEKRLRRFQREAKVLASLNHPNIASIYGLEQSGETHYLVLELVPGETLADRIARAPIPVDEALEIGAKIAEALEEAHEQGIVHRDLKPANIKLTEDGKVKVLDFGLAKAFTEEVSEGDAATSMSPTITRDATRVGVILGTAAYMSPEQAKGKRVDKRTDIFAFGAVLYEMLNGKKAFPGDDVSEVLAAVIKSEPDWSRLSNAHLLKLLRRCLEKDSRRRLRDIGDARLELESTPDAELVPVPSSRNLLWLGLAAGLTAGLAVAFALKGGSSEPVARGVTRFAVPRPAASGVHFDLPMLALSPDGSKLVYGGEDGVMVVRRMESEETEPIPGSSGNAPFFSPDGEWLGLFSQGELKKVSLTGGSSETIAPVSSFRGADWGDDGNIVYADRRSGIWRVSADGGEPELVVRVEGMVAGHPELVGDGKLLFGSLGEESAEQSQIMAATLARGVVKPLNLRGAQPRYLPSGHLVFVDQGRLKAVAFDPESMEVRGAPVTLIEGLTDPGGILVAHYTVSDSGSLAYWVFAPTRRLSWVDRRGNALSTLSEPRGYADLRLSPDGRSLAIFDLSSTLDIWTYDFARETFARISLSPQTDEIPVWSPDGRSVAYTTTRPEGFGRILHRRASDGSGAETALWETPYHTHVADWTDNGEMLVLNEDRTTADTGWDVLVLNTEGAPSPRYVLESRFDERNPRLHPGGKWLAYMSDETGQYEIYVTSFPEAGAKHAISTGGGFEPVWSKDGSELLYRNGTDIMAVEVMDESEFIFSKPVALFRDTFEDSAGASHTAYDVHPDGRFLFVTRPVADEDDPYRGVSQYHLVFNWVEEVKRLVPIEN